MVGEGLHPEYSRLDYQLEKIAEWLLRYWSSLQVRTWHLVMHVSGLYMDQIHRHHTRNF
ncbi:hypothetical protein Peur_010239 [Populus x canadensis]